MNKYFKKGAYLVIALSLLISCITGVSRIQKERQYKALEIAIRYIDVIAVAQQKDLPIEDVLEDLKAKGATSILVRENTLLPNTAGDLANWKAQGKLTAYEGYEILKMHPEVKGIEEIVRPELSYVWMNDPDVYKAILNEIKGQKLGGNEITLGNKSYIEYRGDVASMGVAGMGFPMADLNIAAELGYSISPQIKSWGSFEEGYVDTIVKTIEAIPSLGPVYFADEEIPGLKIQKTAEINPKIVDLLKSKQIGLIEFFSDKQKGLYTLIRKTSEGGENYKAVRLHTTADGEVNKLSSPEIMSRYWLAATERNQQVLLFKMANTKNIYEDFARLEDEIEEFVSMAPEKGFKITGQVESYNLPKGNFVFAFLSGLGAIAVFVLFLDFIGLRKLGVILGSVGMVGYAGILLVRPTLGLKLMALFGASIFPSYAVLWALDRKTQGLKETIVLFLQTCIISFGGALTIIGLLSRTSFGLTMDLFTGVKIAHLIPIVLVIAGHLYKQYDGSVDFIKEVARHQVTYLALAAIGLVGVALIIYTSRTGNAGTVSSLELTFRSTLDRLLGVRPRTKEFAIGYPLLMAIYYYGYKENYLPVLAIAIIGQISLVNTYAHIHTPILISLIRSGYGIVFGLIFGLILIYVINTIIKVAKRWKLIEK